MKEGTFTQLFMIHKIEIYPHYTYPLVSKSADFGGKQDEHPTKNDINSNDQSQGGGGYAEEETRLDFIHGENLLPPYRTVSHYGFNYPSTYIPNIPMHPACSITPVNLQRQRVIAFIKRLNAEVNENPKVCSKKTTNGSKKDTISKTGKEERIYENANAEAINSAESFISMAEIQLNAAKEKINLHVKSSQKRHDVPTRETHRKDRVDLQSNEFSSLLSISGTYPAATHSHIEDAENDHFTTTDSGDNFSSFELQSSRKSTNDNLYRSYLQRNYAPEIIDSRHSLLDLRARDDEPDPHKPESEQQPQNNVKTALRCLKHPESKHITLTLNSLKRRASSVCDKKEKSSPQEKTLSSQAVLRTHFSDANSSCDSSTASTAIEIHININVRNSDCVKNLQSHEQEFKSKLEKVIDDEIHLITQQLALSSQCEKESKTTTSLNSVPLNRCLSAPESMWLYGRDPSITEADRQSLFNSNDHVLAASTTPLNVQTLRYRQTLALLEQELEILLNGIIRNMCDCKTKIAQISEDIRTASLYVGPLKTIPSKKSRERNKTDSSN